MKRLFVFMIAFSLLIGSGCSNSDKKEEHSLSVSEIESSVESSTAIKDVSEKSVAESSLEENSEISQVKEISESESSSESKVESQEESESESIAESSAESITEESSRESSEEESSKEISIPVTNKKIAGFYNLTEYTENGETVLDLKSHNDRGLFATATINEDGTGEFDKFGDILTLQWNDKYIIFGSEKAEYELDKDMLILFDGDMEMVFERADKESLIPSEQSKEIELSGQADSSHAGKYMLSAILIDGFDDIPEVTNEEGWYIVLNKNGTGEWVSDDETLEIKWTKGQLTDGNEIFYYTLENNVLSIEISGIKMEYTKV